MVRGARFLLVAGNCICTSVGSNCVGSCVLCAVLLAVSYERRRKYFKRGKHVAYILMLFIQVLPCVLLWEGGNCLC